MRGQHHSIYLNYFLPLPFILNCRSYTENDECIWCIPSDCIYPMIAYTKQWRTKIVPLFVTWLLRITRIMSFSMMMTTYTLWCQPWMQRAPTTAQYMWDDLSPENVLMERQGSYANTLLPILFTPLKSFVKGIEHGMSNHCLFSQYVHVAYIFYLAGSIWSITCSSAFLMQFNLWTATSSNARIVLGF